MATYKKQLRDKDNNIIYPAQGLGTITGENIDWTTTAQSYSTTEVNTGATWTGGETIYKKTIHGTFSSVPSSGLSWNHNISGLSYVVKIETAFKLGWETAWGNDGFLAMAGMAVRVNSTKVYIDTNSSNSYNGAVDVTLWYTKSS